MLGLVIVITMFIMIFIGMDVGSPGILNDMIILDSDWELFIKLS